MRTLCLALLLWLLPTCVMAAPGSIRACMENSDSPPWLLMSGEGIVQFHLKEVANRIGHPIILTPFPGNAASPSSARASSMPPSS